MDISDIYTNPIVIALLAGSTTYIYMGWKNDIWNNKDKDFNKDKDRNKNKNKNKDEKKKKDVNLLIPFIVFVVVWFISYAYVNSYEENVKVPVKNVVPTVATIATTATTLSLPKRENIIAVGPPTNGNAKISSDSGSPVSFKLQSKSNGIHIPDTLPEIYFPLR